MILLNALQLTACLHDKTIEIQREFVTKRFDGGTGRQTGRRSAGLTLQQRYELEVRALQRIASVPETCDDNNRHFPRLILHDDAIFALRTSHDGVPLSGGVICRLSEAEVRSQAACIRDLLRRANVTHCDMSPANFLLRSDNRTLVMYDFDISASRFPAAPASLHDVQNFWQLRGGHGVLPEQQHSFEPGAVL